MNKNTIEILVVGPVGSGKSQLLDLIDRALRSEYGRDVCIESPDLESERRMGSPGAKPDVTGVIFELKEAASLPQLGEAHACSFSLLDPIEQAIEQTVRLVGETSGDLAHRLSRHLDSLLEAQIDKVRPRNVERASTPLGCYGLERRGS